MAFDPHKNASRIQMEISAARCDGYSGLDLLRLAELTKARPDATEQELAHLINNKCWISLVWGNEGRPNMVKHEGQIRGAFKGWKRGALFKLTNGQAWEQLGYDYRYKYIYSPRATIKARGDSYWLQVEGMDDEVEVKRRK